MSSERDQKRGRSRAGLESGWAGGAATKALTAARLALSSVRRTPGRSALTAFGILVGIAAVTIVVSLAEGAARVVSGSIDVLGANALMVSPRAAARSGVRDADQPSPLTDGDVEALAGGSSNIVHAAPVVNSMQQVVSEQANAAASVVGTTREFFPVRDFRVTRGEIWSPGAEANRERVCLIGETTRATLFGPEDPVGRTIRIGRFPFRVIGLLGRKGQSPFGGDQDDVIVMPLPTLRTKVGRIRPNQVHSILLAAKDAAFVDAAKADAVSILRQRHRVQDDAPDDFDVRTQEEFRQTQRAIVGVMQMLLLGIATVSLVVGGIGVMNIMLVSVAERTREIGIRLSIGAREGDILAQFLVEATVLTVLGGILGTLAGFTGILVLRRALEIPMRLSWDALLVALGTSAAMGVTFGFFPARQAARLDPIEALRAE